MNNTLGQKINFRTLLRFTLPSVVMMVVMSLYTVVDGTFVSRLVGTDAFSAVNIVWPLLSVIVGLGTMFGTGLTAVVSRKLGEGKLLEARQNLTFVILFAACLAAAISAICLALLEPMIYLMGADEAVFPYCYDYALPLILFFPVNILQIVFQSLYVADGKPGIGLLVTVLGGLANVALDYVFIAVLHMGVAGAAIATGIGYFIPSAYGCLYFLLHRKGTLFFVKPKAAWRVLLNACANGSSEMVSNLSTSVTTLLFNIIMMTIIGPDGVAAIGILLYLDFVLIAISLGYSIGVAPLIGYNYGRGDHVHLKKLYRLSLGLSVGIGVFMTVATEIFAGSLAGIFTSRDSQVYLLAVEGLRIYAVSYLFKGYNVFASAMFTAFGDGKTSALLSCMRTLVFLVASTLGLTALFGLTGVWSASPVAEGLALVMAAWYTIGKRKEFHYL